MIKIEEKQEGNESYFIYETVDSAGEITQKEILYFYSGIREKINRPIFCSMI